MKAPNACPVFGPEQVGEGGRVENGRRTRTYPRYRLHSAEWAPPYLLHNQRYLFFGDSKRPQQHSAPRDVLVRRCSALRPFRFPSASASTDFRSAHDLIATRNLRAVISPPEDPAIFPGAGEPESDLADADEDEEGTADDRGSVDTTNNDVDEDKEDDENDSESEGESCAAATSSAAPSRGAPVANASTQPYAPAPFQPPCLYPYPPVVPTFPRPRGLPGAPHPLPRRQRVFNSRGPGSAGHLLGHRGA